MAGIDQFVSETADAYRGNPQQLEQRYAASQQLIDLLALQRLKSEKDAAARQVQMQMEQNPATIMQQREQELTQRTKQEMLERVAPTLQRKMSQQQAAMQQAPQQAQRAQQGIAQLQQQMQRPQQRAASGGMVKSYAEGGRVESESSLTAEELEKVRQLTSRGYSTEEAKQIVAKQRNANFPVDEYTPEQKLPETKSLGRMASEGIHSLLGMEAPPMVKPQAPEGAPAQPAAPAPAPVPNAAPAQPKPQPAAPAMEKPPIPMNTGSGAGGMNINRVNATPDAAIEQYQKGVSGLTDEMAGIELEKPDSMGIRKDVTEYVEETMGPLKSEEELGAQKDKEFEDTLERMNMDDRLSEYDKTLKVMRETFERQNDPDRRRRQRISAFLRGFAGTSNLGVGFARASQARAEQVEKADAAERSAQKQLYEVMQARDATEGDIRKAAETSALRSYESAMAKQNTLLDVVSRMTNQEVQATSNYLNTKYNGQMKVLGEKANAMNEVLRAQMQKFESLTRSSTAERSMRPQSLMALARLMNSFSEAESAAMATVLDKLQGVSLIMNSDDASPEEKMKAKDTIALAFKSFHEESGLQYYAPLIRELALDIGVELPEINADNQQEIDPDEVLTEAGSAFLN